MRIAIFTNNYLPNPYGVANSVESFRKKFETWNHEVFIFAPQEKDYQDENPRVFRYPSISTNIRFKFSLPIPYSRKIDKTIIETNLDIVHSQHPNLLGTAALKWARKKKVPLVFTWHTLYDRYANFVPFLPKSWVAYWTIKNAVKYANQADLVIVPTKSIIGILRKWGVTTPIEAVASGIEERFFQNADRASVRKKFNIKEDDVVLLLVSRLTGEKNVSFVFQALTRLLKKNKQLKFLVAGNGYLLPELKKLAEKEELSEKIIFSGLVPKEELKNYYAAGDIYVSASQSETQGMNVSEAMYMGLPIVAVKATGTNSLVKNGENGLLVSENAKEFSRAVEKLIADSDLRKSMSLTSAQIARENFTDEVCAKKMLKVYESLIK
ncbi:glycosyltransferase [Patescibacteria group bacterium]|nr:glycosyltransferase [Patescibacteria group bacterium]